MICRILVPRPPPPVLPNQRRARSLQSCTMCWQTFSTALRAEHTWHRRICSAVISISLTTPQPNLLWLKKAQAIWRGVLTAEVLKFPKEKHNVAFTLLKAATRLEKSSPEDCIALQRRALDLMALELKQARYAAFAAEKALEEVLD